MSHSSKDQPGSHPTTFLNGGDGCCFSGIIGRRFGKKFTAREARREARRIKEQGVRDYEDDLRHAAEDALYEWEDERESHYWEVQEERDIWFDVYSELDADYREDEYLHYELDY